MEGLVQQFERMIQEAPLCKVEKITLERMTDMINNIYKEPLTNVVNRGDT